MKGPSALILGLGLLVAVGMLLTSHRSPAGPAIPKNVVKWEYKVVKGDDLPVPEEEDYLKSCMKGLNKLGDEGWEMAAASNGWLVFKRQK
jgi:hypothetical protein